MFGFLKKKLKDAVAKISKRVDSEVEDRVVDTGKKGSAKPDIEETRADEFYSDSNDSKKYAEPEELLEDSEEITEEEPEEPLPEQLEEVPEEFYKTLEEEGSEAAEISEEQEAEEQEEETEEEKEQEAEEESDIESEIIEPYPEEQTPALLDEFDREEKIKTEIQDKVERIREHKDEVKREIAEIKLEIDEDRKREEIKDVKEKIEIIDEEVKDVEEKKGFLSRIFGRKKKDEPVARTESSAKKETFAKQEHAAKPEPSVRKEHVAPAEKTVEKQTIGKSEIRKPSIGKPAFEKTSAKPESKLPEARAVETAEPEEKKKGFFSRIAQTITTKTISESKFEDLFWELEMAMLENNVAVEVIEKIKDDLKGNLVGKPIPRSKVSETIVYSLRESIEDLFDVPQINIVEKIREKKPYVIVFVGVNGSGKTTTIAKFAKMLLDNKFSVVLGAADTFRAAAIDQLQMHADNLGIKMIKHDYGSDPAAVAFDTIRHAESSGKDVVLIDTAGRLHSNTNLMDEMKKILRVANPDLTIFIGESITGNDCIEQAKMFDEAAGFDAIVLSKADVDEKGGTAVSISYVTKKPILYLGMGQEYDDLKKFDPKIVLEGLGLA